MLRILEQKSRNQYYVEKHRRFNMKIFLGLITPLIAYAVITLLHIAIPAKRIKGYVKNEKTGEVMQYRINGKFVLPASIVIWFLLGYFNIVPYVWLYETRWLGLISAVVIGLIYSLYIVLKHPSTGKSFLADFWFGRAKDPQIKNGFIDSKLWLYLIGAVMLQLNVLSFAAYHLTNVARHQLWVFAWLRNAHVVLFEYLFFEKIHLWTYDFIAERVGFKLGFGCLAFYPFFYSVSLWFTAHFAKPRASRVGNDPDRCAFPVRLGADTRCKHAEVLFQNSAKQQVSLDAAAGADRWQPDAACQRLLGRKPAHQLSLERSYKPSPWRLLPDTFGIWMVWLYPIYYIGLMFSRQADDDKVCKKKYGALWDEYTEKVKYKIIPFIY